MVNENTPNTNPETDNDGFPKTIDEQVEEVMKGLRPNTTERIVRGIVLTAGIVGTVVFGTASLGWTKWLLRVLSGFLGLGLSETYGWMKNRSDSKRFREIIQRTGEIYAGEGENRAEDYLRSELAKYEEAEKRRREAFERKIGDVDAVSVQAAEAKRDAAEATRMVEKAAENLEDQVTRMEDLDKKIDEVGDKATGMIKGINQRLDALGEKAKKAVPIESVKTTTKKTPAKKTTRKKAANS